MSCVLCPTEFPAMYGDVCAHDFWAMARRLDPDHRGDLAAHDPASIPRLYALLDPMKDGQGDGGRRAPGFVSACPADLHAVALTDSRSRVNGRPWLDRANRWHWEQGVDDAPIHAGNSLGGWVRLVAEERGLDVPRVPDERPKAADYIGPMPAWEDDLATTNLPPSTDVADLAGMLHRHLEWICGRGWVDEFAADTAQLHAQLRSATRARTGEHRPRPIGVCPEPHPASPREPCGAPLWSTPDHGVRCAGCGHRWRSDDLVALGDLLTDAATVGAAS